MGCGFLGEWGGILGFEWNWRGVGGAGLYTGSGVSGESGVSGVRVLWRFGAWRVAPGVLSSFSDSGIWAYVVEFALFICIFWICVELMGKRVV